MRTLSIDIETYSGTDLAKSGVFRYAESPDFEVMLFGYSADGGPVHVIDLASGEKLPRDVLNALTDESVLKWAHNAQFERVCLSQYLGSWLSADSWRCTMVWSAYLGLPLSLEGAALVSGAGNDGNFHDAVHHRNAACQRNIRQAGQIRRRNR